LLLFGLAVFTLGRHSDWGSFELLLLAGSAVLAFRARRDLWMLVLSAVTVLTTVRPVAEEKPVHDHFRWTWVRCLAVAGMLLAAAAGLWRARGLTEERQWQAVAETFPVEAARLVRERGCPGPLFNQFDWGGYLIWSLPDLPVAIDGRTNLHGEVRLDRYNRVWAGLPDLEGRSWQDDPDLSASGVIIAPKETALAELLRFDPRFEEVPTDDPVARVFIRRK
jgi:hypothetical protein